MRARRPRRALAAWAVAAALIAAGCDGSEEPDADPEPRPVETVDEPPTLPRGWRLFAAPELGFALGVPRDWDDGRRCAGKRGPRPRAHVALLCSPDRLVSLSISVDRTEDALAIPIEEFATRTIRALDERSFGGRLEIGRPRPFRSAYEAVVVSGSGRTSGPDRVRQRVRVVVIRREGLANFTAVIAENVAVGAATQARIAERALTTLRSQPVTLAPG